MINNFEPFTKIPRLSREVIVTEKIDGRNAQVYITDDFGLDDPAVCVVNGLAIFAGSRNRWLYPTKLGDNYGFASWVRENAEQLVQLGPGRHFGEWWGKGIQRGYGLDERRFSLFNVHRWGDVNSRPACCSVVPVLYRGSFTTDIVETALRSLRIYGSCAAPGFDQPEGVVIYHTQARLYFKKTLKDDGVPKTATGVSEIARQEATE